MHQPPLSLRRRQRAIRVASVCACWLLAVVATVAAGPPAAPAAAPAFDADAPHRALISRHCLGCHNNRLKTAGLELDALVEQHENLDRATWEKVARKLRARQMPPPGRRRPDESAYREALSSLEGELDRIAAEAPDPGRTETFRRLNRTEYHNAVRDLLALEVDVASLLPADSASYGFDNVTVGDLSPTLLERYVGAAEKISRLAVGRSYAEPVGITFRTDPDLTQEKHVEGLPIGTRGGLLATWNFPADGVYEFSIRLARDRNEHVEGLREPHDLELLIDRERIETFTVAPPDLMSDVALNYQPSQDDVDDHLVVRVPVTAGRTTSASPSRPGPGCCSRRRGSPTSRISTTTATPACSRPSSPSRLSGRTCRSVRATRRAASGSSSASRRTSPRRTPARGRSWPT